MKKICFVNPSSIFGKIGGAEVQIYILASEAVKQGWDVYYLTSPTQIPNDNNTGFKFVPFKGTGSIESEKKAFIAKLHEINPDYIYQRGRKLWTYYCGSFSETSHSKFIFASSMDIDCYKHKFLFRSTNSLREIYGRFKNWRFNSQLDKHTLESIKYADLVLSQTNTQQHLFKKNLDINSKIFPNIHPIPTNNQYKADQTKPTVLWLARLRAWKQPEHFIKLAYACKELNCHFLMAGRLSDGKYQNQIQKAQIDLKNFNYLGSVPFDESNRLIANSDLFINTSKEEEGFPNTYIQAWLRKVPVVALNFDPDNVIKNYKLGSVTKNFKNLVEMTKKFILDTEMREKTGETAFKFAVNHYSVESNIDRFFSMIQKS